MEKIQGKKGKKEFNEEVLSNFVYNATAGIIEKNKQELPKIYDAQFGDYYLQYCKEMGLKNIKTEKEAIDSLNKEFIKCVQGTFIPVVKKTRSLNKSYIVFQDICASCRIQMREKYGEFNYYEMEKSENPKAREEYAKFEQWVTQTQKTFEQYKEEVDKYEKSIEKNKKAIKKKAQSLNKSNLSDNVNTPDELISRSIFAATGAAMFWAGTVASGISLGALIFDEGGKKALVGAIAGLAVAVIGDFMWKDAEELHAIFGSEEDKFAFYNQIDEFFKQFGFDDRHDAYNYINDKVSILPQSEKEALIDAIIENQKLTIAQTYGYNSVQSAMEAAQEAAKAQTLTLDGALQIQSEEYADVQNIIARRFGFKDYQHAVEYLNAHKVISEETDVVNFDDLISKTMSKEFNKLDNYQSNAINSIKAQSWPQEVTDYGEFNQMMYEMKSSDVFKEIYYNKMLSNKNYGYGADNVANAMYSDLVDKVGVDDANKYAEIPTKQTTLESAIDSINSDQNLSISEMIDPSMLWLSGFGLVSGTVIKSIPGIKALATKSKQKKLVKSIVERSEQVKADAETRKK